MKTNTEIIVFIKEQMDNHTSWSNGAYTEFDSDWNRAKAEAFEEVLNFLQEDNK